MSKKSQKAPKGPVRCPILPNWMTRKDGTCKRSYICKWYKKDPRCPAK